jgi:hypothetical protein
MGNSVRGNRPGLQEMFKRTLELGVAGGVAFLVDAP